GTPTLLDNIALNDASVHSYSNTFDNSNTPGNNFPLKGKIAFQFSDNVSVTFDDLNISAPYFYPGGCAPSQSPLPVKLISFQGNMNNSKVSLQWTVAENEINDHFEVEKSIDGKGFETAGIIVASSKYGSETYSFNEAMNTERIYYRLKMFDKNQVITYSKILMFISKAANNSSTLKIVNNPTTDKLTLSFSANTNQSIEIKVYDLSGRLQMNQKMNIYQGSNLISLQLNSSFKAGMYAVEVNNGSERQTAKFVKQ
ncbi:MAG TPA: T9SS type A sorting domain-containing protein, partial [Ignavibacteria bacterium]